MTYFWLSYSPAEVCNTIVEEQLNSLDISFALNDLGELILNDRQTDEKRMQIEQALSTYGISLIAKDAANLVQAIKYAVEELLCSPDIRTQKVSTHLSEKLGYSYAYLSNRFSEETYTSIENFIILGKIEKAKKLMLAGRNSLTEIAYNLDYSSVAHLSGQFKKITGLSPTTFLRIIEKRNKSLVYGGSGNK